MRKTMNECVASCACPYGKPRNSKISRKGVVNVTHVETHAKNNSAVGDFRAYSYGTPKIGRSVLSKHSTRTAKATAVPTDRLPVDRTRSKQAEKELGT